MPPATIANPSSNTGVADIFMTPEQIIELSKTDYLKAQAILDLQDRLAARQKKDSEVAKQTALQVTVLKSWEQQIREQKAAQDQCEAGMHRRPDGVVAISGQRTGDGKYILVCCRCAKNFFGIGEGKGMLPRHIANQIDMNSFGG